MTISPFSSYICIHTKFFANFMLENFIGQFKHSQGSIFFPWTFSPEKLVKKDWCLLCLWCKTKKSTKSVTSKRWRPNAFWVQNWVVFAKSIKGKPYPLREGILETCKDNILEYEKNCMVRTKDTISWKKGAKNTVQSGVTSERKIKTLITQKVWKLRQ